VVGVITADEIEQLLALNHEIRSFELKGPGQLTDKAYVARVARATMAMGNLRDGGLVCLGVADDKISAMLPGLDRTQRGLWSDFDRVSAALARYSEPPVSFELHAFTLSNGAEVVVIEVAEFERDLHVCKLDYPNVLQAGHTYVRPRGQPRSVTVPSSAEMRELHDLAIDKGVREFVRRARAAGISLSSLPEPEDLERAAIQRESQLAWAEPSTVDYESSATAARVGFTDVAIRPGPYDAERLRPDQLEAFVAEHAVRLRGWPVPMVGGRQPIRRHGSWIGQDLSAEVVPHVEAWRMFTSAQFLHRRVLATDLRNTADLSPNVPGATGAVAVWDVLLYMVEIAEFGARLATTLRCSSVTFDVALDHIQGRELISGDFGRELHGPYIVATDRLSASFLIEVTQLVAEPREVGVQLTQGLLRQFGLSLPDQILFDWQEQIFRRA
jgi:hypothetical protein